MLVDILDYAEKCRLSVTRVVVSLILRCLSCGSLGDNLSVLKDGLGYRIKVAAPRNRFCDLRCISVRQRLNKPLHIYSVPTPPHQPFQVICTLP